MGSNTNFKLVSLNARGIRSFDKRNAIFNWFLKTRADICFVQETLVHKKLKMLGKNNGRVICSFPMQFRIAEVSWC